MKCQGGLPVQRWSPVPVLAAAAGKESNSRPSTRKSNSLTTGLPNHSINRIDVFYDVCSVFGYIQCRLTVAELMDKSDRELFCKLCAPTHALNHLLPPTRNNICLRARGHCHQLPEYSTNLHKKSFVTRCLYRPSFVK